MIVDNSGMKRACGAACVEQRVDVIGIWPILATESRRGNHWNLKVKFCKKHALPIN